MKKKISCIFTDFDGVLCKDYFYNSLAKYDPIIYGKINNEIFKGERNLIHQRMKGEINYEEINSIISQRYGIDKAFLQKVNLESIDNMVLNQELIIYYGKLRKKGFKVFILTDNMDTFTNFLVPKKKLKTLFDGIFTSCDYKVLKGESGGKLLDIAINSLQVPSSEVLIIDDWLKMKEIIESKGGIFYHFDSRQMSKVSDLEKRFDSNIILQPRDIICSNITSI